MARARNIKPSIMDNEALAELAPLSRLLFIYLWMLADKEGRLEDRPKRIAAQALPYDRDADVNAILDDLTRSGFITRYVSGGVACIQISAFTKHQNPHVREAASTLPAQEESTTKEVPSTSLGCDEASPRSPDSLIPDSLIPDSLIPEEQAASTAEPLPPEQPPVAADPIHGRAIELTAMLRQRGAALQASDPRVRAWAECGVTDAQALAALETAQQRRQDACNPQPINAGYLDSIIRDPPTANARASPPPARSGRAARIDNYAAQAAEARGEHGEQRGIRGTERDITGEVVIVA